MAAPPPSVIAIAKLEMEVYLYLQGKIGNRKLFGWLMTVDLTHLSVRENDASMQIHKQKIELHIM